MARATKRLTAVDLFAGCGGLSLGLQRAGFAVLGAIEIDPLAVEAYRANHAGVRVWERDIRKVPVAEVLRCLRLKRGALTLLAGCPPCQGFSRLRSRNGSRRVRDARNDLVLEFLRFVRGLRPKAVMLENVPGLVTNRRFRHLTRRLKEFGYEVEYRVLDAAEYGVPQRRRRLILVASRLGTPRFGRRGRLNRTVRMTIAHLPRIGRSGDALHDQHTENRSKSIRELIRNVPRNGGSRTSLSKRFRLACHSRCDGFWDVYGRMRWDDVAPTITSGFVNPSKGRFLHPSCHRTLTLREGALLQSFPPNYWFPGEAGKYPVAEMIGNALPPEFVRRHALALRRHLETAKSS